LEVLEKGSYFEGKIQSAPLALYVAISNWLLAIGLFLATYEKNNIDQIA
jgi:hypothetical protein